MVENLLNDKKKKILLEKEVKQLEKKQEELSKLKLEYYNEYFNIKREDFALLTDIPSNPNDKDYKNDKHVLYQHSVLNVDTVGKIICQLIKRYDHRDVISKRLILRTRGNNAFGTYPVEIPKLVIGQKDEVEDLYKNEHNIIINYNEYMNLNEYPTNNPVKWCTSSVGNHYKKSNYNHLIDYYDGLSFNYPGNLEYIKELIFSLAYYQREHDIKYMMPEDTWNVYKKIYKK